MEINTDSRTELRAVLIDAWEQFVNNLLNYPDPFYMDEDEESEEQEDSISYKDMEDIVNKTREYFETLPVKGCMDKDDLKLYESANALRFLKLSFEPAENIKDYNRLCKKTEELFENLEAISK